MAADELRREGCRLFDKLIMEFVFSKQPSTFKFFIHVPEKFVIFFKWSECKYSLMQLIYNGVGI